MGTNYYLIDSLAWSACGGRKKLRRHIGKSSAGWCFALRVYPEEGINTLDDWERVMLRHNGMGVVDEYGTYVPRQTMLSIITDRGWPGEESLHDPETLKSNHACAGPNGLLRSLVDGVRCIGHGEGTWDYFLGDFS